MNKSNTLSQQASRYIRLVTLAAITTVSSNYAIAQKVEHSAPAGNGIYEAVISNVDGHIYVTGAGNRTNPGGALYKINPSNLSIVDSISLKENPPFGIGINQKTQLAYTSNTRTSSVSVIDLKTGKLVTTITNGEEKSHTREVLVDEDNNMIYITDVGKPGNIWVIDGNTNTYSHSIPNTGQTTTGLTFAGSKDIIYVTNMGDNTIGVIDVNKRELIKSFPSGGESPVNITSDGEHLFVTNQKSGTLTILDKEGKLLKSIETGDGAIGIAYDPVENRLYSANRQTGTTTVLDAKTYEILADLPTGSHPNHVKVNPETGEAYVLNKAKGGRPVEGEPVKVDTNGDTITKIN